MSKAESEYILSSVELGQVEGKVEIPISLENTLYPIMNPREPEKSYYTYSKTKEGPAVVIDGDFPPHFSDFYILYASEVEKKLL